MSKWAPGLALGMLLTVFIAARLEAANPDCSGLPNSGLSSKDTIIPSGTSPLLGVWWGNWSPAASNNVPPTFFIVRSVSGFSVDATYIYQGVTQDNNDQWRLESDGHIGADLQAISTAYIWKLNPSGDVLMGTRYYREQQTGTIVMTRCNPTR